MVDEKEPAWQEINEETSRGKVAQLMEAIKSKRKIMNTTEMSRLNRRSSFRNRFESQKKTIELQRNKLKVQERIINELKAGVIADEVRDISQRTRIEISDLFSDCLGTKLIGRVDLERIPFDEREKLSIKTQSAPRILQEIEAKSLTRMKYREMIKERKLMFEEMKRKSQEEALARKRCLEEEEKLKYLELMKKKRREEIKRKMIRQANKAKYLNNLTEAVNFEYRSVIARAFSKWKFEYKWFREKMNLSNKHYEETLLRNCFEQFKLNVRSKYERKFDLADHSYRRMLSKKVIESFRKNRSEGTKALQVAEDFHDFKLQINAIEHWRTYMKRARILNDIKIQQAIYHHKRKLYFQCLYNWKTLPMVMRLEKAKEERKAKWRRKVLEILPDFNPNEL